jgi:hypothetical protein
MHLCERGRLDGRGSVGEVRRDEIVNINASAQAAGRSKKVLHSNRVRIEMAMLNYFDRDVMISCCSSVIIDEKNVLGDLHNRQQSPDGSGHQRQGLAHLRWRGNHWTSIWIIANADDPERATSLAMAVSLGRALSDAVSPGGIYCRGSARPVPPELIRFGVE